MVLNKLLERSLLRLFRSFSQADGVEQASATVFVTSIQKLSLCRRCEQASDRKSVPSNQKFFPNRWCKQASDRKSVSSIQKFFSDRWCEQASDRSSIIHPSSFHSKSRRPGNPFPRRQPKLSLYFAVLPASANQRSTTTLLPVLWY